jgi:hypothetical protein
MHRKWNTPYQPLGLRLPTMMCILFLFSAFISIQLR